MISYHTVIRLNLCRYVTGNTYALVRLHKLAITVVCLLTKFFTKALKSTVFDIIVHERNSSANLAL